MMIQLIQLIDQTDQLIDHIFFVQRSDRKKFHFASPSGKCSVLI